MKLNLNGDVTAELHLELPGATRAALEYHGIEAPREVLLLLREATGREQETWALEQQTVGQTDPLGWATRLILRRAAPDTDERVVREMLNDTSSTVMAQLIMAYITGVVPDPKALMAAIQGSHGQILAVVLGQLAAGTTPSSPTSTASPSETSPISPPATSTT